MSSPSVFADYVTRMQNPAFPITMTDSKEEQAFVLGLTKREVYTIMILQGLVPTCGMTSDQMIDYAMEIAMKLENKFNRIENEKQDAHKRKD